MANTDRAAVAGLAQRTIAAWCRHDADAFADLFVPDGTMILPGVYCSGREEIRAYMTAAFDGPLRGSQVTGQPLQLKFLCGDVALLLTEGGIVGPGDIEVKGDLAIRGSWIAVRDEAEWRLAAYQNSPRS
ncbi:SgcJ/EcaC family oxidoreductase [Hamadaea sp. NPDC050747]|uniref:SgcJ/EcaC family oxidoreductase n=1 Tax=Hamadaea sp. NPDC050747 TaxID=3155789 RepID=UPI0033C6A5EF